jgi:hypothetical protein
MMTFDLRTWALHDAVFQLARESGLDAFRVECKHGPEGETVIALVLRNNRPRRVSGEATRPVAPNLQQKGK